MVAHPMVKWGCVCPTWVHSLLSFTLEGPKVCITYGLLSLRMNGLRKVIFVGNPKIGVLDFGKLVNMVH